ncbi:hypothetical protein T459_14264 [Capsicum annuum]|uniref:Uncharacterized protein n=1 Tax=Capsicum annuum TaxID=4072 RepID=A0A2G2ZGW9_CAPAN|nr:hypothetical protein T459_14264 [Capsicum annuum]
MCDMLMSIKDASFLEQIERDCTVVSDAMLSFPIMIPGTRNYKGIKDIMEVVIANALSGSTDDSSEDQEDINHM